MKKVSKMVTVTMTTMMFVTGIMTKVEASEIGNNTLKAGKIINIEYSENLESDNWKEFLDKIYFEIDGHTYLYYDIAEDMFIDDDVLVIMNDRGTENPEDDIIRSYRFWRPDLELKSENDYFDMVENGSCIN